MIQPWVFSIEWENHCRSCIHNSNDYWCDKYKCCPCQALTLCNADGFHFETTVCIPDGASCYMFDLTVGFTGKVRIRLLEY